MPPSITAPHFMDSVLSTATMNNQFGLCRTTAMGCLGHAAPLSCLRPLEGVLPRAEPYNPGQTSVRRQVSRPICLRECGLFHTPVLQEDTDRRLLSTTHTSCQGPFSDRCDPSSWRHLSAPGTWLFTVPSLKLLCPAPKWSTGLYRPTLIATQFRIFSWR